MPHSANDLVRIPSVLMRGGTSRGPFFLRADLPAAPAARDAVLIAAMGAGHELQVDGIGGGHPLTSKAAIVGRSRVAGADVDYLFAQVKVRERAVDTSPNCGNMLAAVGPFAIESGLVAATDGTTLVRIHNVNTGKLIEARVATPGGRVTYDGDTAIDGVPGTAAPVYLTFLDAAGAKTGALLPTGAPVDRCGGVEVSCVDAAMPVTIVRARDFGKTGHETPAELEADRAFMARLEQVRVAAGARMGIADAADRVIPKPVLVAPGANGATLATRYFMPHQCHTALATTGAVAIATACATPGTIAHAIAGRIDLPATLSFEHPSGHLEVRLERRDGIAQPVAAIVRTARRLFEGAVLVKRSALGHDPEARAPGFAKDHAAALDAPEPA
ncbi:MAG TPA: 4-oxalomesaconate tautomerase [Xanthobacteraceae bacterium]|nr:4-oxalomesaconate tautomerase [Xanthobacteraceae bacterium]